MSRPVVAALAALLLLILLSACRARVELVVDVGEDGSGTVTVTADLDDEAVEAVGQGAFRKVRVADLKQAGWSVAVGAHTVSATKVFASAGELDDVVAEVSGPEGPFRDFQVEREAGALRTSWDFRGTVDLREGAASLLNPQDEVIQREFAAEGLDVGEMREELRDLLDDALDVEVVVALPGGTERLEAPGSEVTELAAGTTSLEGDRLMLLGGAGLLVLVALALFRGVGRGRRESVDG